MVKPIELSLLLARLILTTPCDGVLSVCLSVGGCMCPISYRDWCAGIDSLKLMNSAPSLASAADDMTA